MGGPLSASGIRVLIPRLVPDEGLERANAIDTGSFALIEIVGPALGGTLIGFGGPAAAMLVIASLYALGAVSLIPVLRAAPRLAADRSMSLLQAAVAGEWNQRDAGRQWHRWKSWTGKTVQVAKYKLIVKSFV